MSCVRPTSTFHNLASPGHIDGVDETVSCPHTYDVAVNDTPNDRTNSIGTVLDGETETHRDEVFPEIAVGRVHEPQCESMDRNDSWVLNRFRSYFLLRVSLHSPRMTNGIEVGLVYNNRGDVSIRYGAKDKLLASKEERREVLGSAQAFVLGWQRPEPSGTRRDGEERQCAWNIVYSSSQCAIDACVDTLPFPPNAVV